MREEDKKLFIYEEVDKIKFTVQSQILKMQKKISSKENKNTIIVI